MKSPDELKPTPSDVSSKDDSPPESETESQHDMSDEERHIKEVEEAYHSNEDVADEEFDIEW